MKDFYALFVHELKSMYGAEKKIVKALPKMVEAAKSEKLKEAFRHHLKETENQVRRLEEIGVTLNEDLKGHDCMVIDSLLKEGKKIIESSYDKVVKDSALICAAQRIEHYEIACYGILKAFAKHFKLKEIEELLEESSKEEGHANKILGEIAEGTLFTSGVNVIACRKCA
jgi:ferritin-like metal-binding protein YciE